MHFSRNSFSVALKALLIFELLSDSCLLTVDWPYSRFQRHKEYFIEAGDKLNRAIFAIVYRPNCSNKVHVGLFSNDDDSSLVKCVSLAPWNEVSTCICRMEFTMKEMQDQKYRILWWNFPFLSLVFIRNLASYTHQRIKYDLPGFYSSIYEVISSGSWTLTAMAILFPLKENDSLITTQGHSKMALHSSFYNR